jgi:type II secretory ATPase GspE/PulE/Tfp pilus assembly ATPase PilB-like protein
MLNEGDTVTEHTRSRDSKTDIEYEIYGEGPDAIPLASMYLCETCSDLYFSLRELGFECVTPDENMRELVAEYAELNRPAETAPRAA